MKMIALFGLALAVTGCNDALRACNEPSDFRTFELSIYPHTAAFAVGDTARLYGSGGGRGDWGRDCGFHVQGRDLHYGTGNLQVARVDTLGTMRAVGPGTTWLYARPRRRIDLFDSVAVTVRAP